MTDRTCGSNQTGRDRTTMGETTTLDERAVRMSRKNRTGVCPERVIVLPSPPWPDAQRPPAPTRPRARPPELTARQRQVLEFIDAEVHQRGYPPSVREIGEAVGLSSPSTVHAHLAALQDKGYLRRDPSKPRAIEVALEPTHRRRRRAPPGAPRPAPRRRRGRHRRARGRARRRGAARSRRPHAATASCSCCGCAASR